MKIRRNRKMRISGDVIYIANIDDGYLVRGEKEEIFDDASDELSGTVSEDFFIAEVSLKVDEDGQFNIRADEVPHRKLLEHVMSE